MIEETANYQAEKAAALDKISTWLYNNLITIEDIVDRYGWDLCTKFEFSLREIEKHEEWKPSPFDKDDDLDFLTNREDDEQA